MFQTEFGKNIVSTKSETLYSVEDRIFGEDINKVAGMIKDFSFVTRVNTYAKEKAWC